MKSLDAIISVDPGVEGGWAWFPKGSKFPLFCRFFAPEKKEAALSFETRTKLVVDRIFDSFKSELCDFRPVTVYCEWPYFANDGSAIVVASSGSLIKLSFWIGHFSGVLAERWPEVIFRPVAVADWKGQLPKALAEKRMRKILGAENWLRLNPKSHAIDAIGIGLWARGEF